MNVWNDVGKQPNEPNKNNTEALKEHMRDVSMSACFQIATKFSRTLSWRASDVSVWIFFFYLLKTLPRLKLSRSLLFTLRLFNVAGFSETLLHRRSTLSTWLHDPPPLLFLYFFSFILVEKDSGHTRIESPQHFLVAWRAEWVLEVAGLLRILEKMLFSGTAPF